jgi:hypothetical protein
MPEIRELKVSVVSMEPRMLFIHGVLQRSGTNFLLDLLSLHSDCNVGGIYEDYLLAGSPLLMRYVWTLTESWNSTWFNEPAEELRRKLAAAMGKELGLFCRSHSKPGQWFVSKTPSTLNLENCFDLFPSARVILIVRDGRDVVESGIRTFGWRWEDAVRHWCISAQRMLTFMAARAGSGQLLLVRYEDLFTDTQREMKRILAFLSLNENRFDFQAADSMHVRGSCEFGRHNGAAVDWRPVARSAEFSPVGRHCRWSARQQQRFAWLAGEISARFGYGAAENANRNLLTYLLDRSLDRYWGAVHRTEEMLFLLNRLLGRSAADFSTGLAHYYERPTTLGERTPSPLPARK